jgi:hypothetical protein
MRTWDELARAAQALLCRAAALREQSWGLGREAREAVGRARAACRRHAGLCEQSRGLLRQRTEGA